LHTHSYAEGMQGGIDGAHGEDGGRNDGQRYARSQDTATMKRHGDVSLESS
jgi:hypothetical protein